MKKIVAFIVLMLLATFVSEAQVPSYVPSNGLVGWWPFNGNVNDQSGNGHNGTTYGSWNYTSDRFGNANAAFNFNTAARVETNATGMFTRQKISISVWVYSVDTLTRAWITKSNWSNAQNEMFSTGQLGWKMYLDLKHNSNCAANIGWSVHRPSAGNYVNTWKHYVLVYDSLQTTIYINGVQQPSFISFNGIDICNGGQLRFGAWWQYDTKYFKGKLDDIGIWNRALDSAEVSNLYNATITGIHSLTNSHLVLFPNPATNEITISNPSAPQVFSILSINGQLLKSGNLATGTQTIDIADFSNGIYLLKTTTATCKFSVAH